MGLRGALSGFYFLLEDRYYALLDKIQKKVPVYLFVDPVDKILPSFGILLAVLVALVGFGLFSAAGGLLGGEKVTLSLTMNDSSGGALSGVVVSLEKDGNVIDTQTTKTNGKVELSVVSGAYQLRAIKDGFESLFQEIELTKNKSQIFSLKDLVSPAKQRVLLIQDASGNVLGVLSSVSISLSFSCQSGAPPASQTSSNGNVTFLQPGNCVGLSVNVSASGFISKTQTILSDTTIISLQDSASLGPPDTAPPTGGAVEVFAKLANGTPIEQVQIKLYKIPAAGSNVLVNQTLSDPNGLGVFERVTPGRHVVIVSKTGFKQTTGTEFQVNAGETVTQTLTVPVSSNKRKIFVKIVSSLNQLPVSGAMVTLFAQTSQGNFIEYDSYTSDVNGMVNQLLADFNGNTSLLVESANYVKEISPNTGIVPEDQSAPVPILLDPLQAANANGTIPNALIINVKVTDEVGLPVFNAAAYLHTPDENGITLSMVRTNAAGIAKFSNLPAGSYQATVDTSTTDGVSTVVQGSVGQIVNLPVVVTLGNALIKVTVKDELNSLVADANVSIYSANGDVLQSRGPTSAQGFVQLGVATGQQVYVKVEKDSYLPFISVPFDVIKNNAHSIAIEVALTSSSQAADISLQRIDQIASNGAATLAQSLVADGLYAFHFTVKSLVAQDQLKSVVRLNGDNSTPQALSDVGRILGGQSAKGAIAFYTTHNPSDFFSPSNSVDSNTPAKVALNSLGDMNGAASYELVVFVKIKTGAVPQTDKLEVRFQAKSNANLSSEYFESYTIGQPLNQSNFSFVFFVTAPGSNTPVQINSAYPLTLEKDQDYTINYQISNTSGNNHPNAVLNLMKDVSTLSTSVNSVSVPMNNNATISGSFTLRSTLACGSMQTFCATLTPTLNGAGGNTPPAFPIKIFTTPAKSLFMSVSPSYLIPSLSQLVQVAVKDQLGAIAGPAQGVQVVGKVKDSAGQVVGSPITFTSSPFKIYSGAIPSAVDGSTLEITASASGYFSDVKTLLVTNQVALNFSQDFDCLTISHAQSPNPMKFSLGGSGTLHLKTVNCPTGLKLYTTGAGAIKLDVADPSAPPGSPLISSTNPLSLGATANRDVTVSEFDDFGMYPLYVYAKYDNQPLTAPSSLITNVDVFVQPLLGANNCLNLSKYIFDIKDGSDVAAVENRCNPLVNDAFYPRITLPVNGAYAHAVPSVLTPELQSPGTPVTFNYTVDVDFDFSSNSNVSLSDFGSVDFGSFAAGDGNWYRYEVQGANQLLVDRSDYIDALPILRFDSIFSRHCSGCPNADHSDFFLEDSQNANQLIKPPGPVPNTVSVLYESTFITTKSVSIDYFCFMTENVQDVEVKIDGVVVQSGINNFNSGGGTGSQYECGSGSVQNVVFAPGAHIIQFFWYRNTTDSRYAIKAKVRDSTFVGGLSVNSSYHKYHKLSTADPEFFLLPEFGIAPKVSLTTMGSFAIVPSASHTVPVLANSLSNLPEGGSIAKILLNKGVTAHLRQAYVNVSTDNPAIRAFTVGRSVKAQYVGFDDPSAQQNVLVEKTTVSGEQYGVMTLEDYSTRTPSGGNVLDLGILVDASASTLLNEPNEQSGTGSIRQEGLCDVVKHLKDSLEYYSGAQVNFKVALMGDVDSFYHNTSNPLINLPCLNEWPGTITLHANDFSGHVSGATYDSDKHDLGESWAWAAEKFSSHSFWSSPNKMMVIITDNKPSGLSDKVSNDAWDAPVEQALVDSASNALNSVLDNGIRGVVLYKTPLESTSAAHFNPNGDPDVAADAIQMYQQFASNTNGFVEALDNSQMINTQNPGVWEYVSYNKVGVRLAQTAFPRDKQSMVVKLVAHPANVCVGENGEVGKSGASAFPKLFYDWRWSAIQKDTCDAKVSDPSNFKYCDSTQFLVSLVQKLRELELAYASAATATQVASIPSLTNFDSYLMYDGLSDDFRSDFVDYFENVTLAEGPDYFRDTGVGSGVWRDYVLSPDRFSFEIDGVENALKIPSPGLYRVRIVVTWDGDDGEFFLASSPHAHIKVVLTKLANASALSGYTELLELPLDGLVGVDDQQTPITMHRNGYGTAFTGALVELVPSIHGMSILYSHPNQPGNTALNTYSIPAQPDAVTLNTQLRGELFHMDRAHGVLYLRPSIPVPLALEWSSKLNGLGDAYYAVKNFSSSTFLSAPSLLKWTPFASIKKQPVFSCTGNNCDICVDGGSNSYISSVALDSNPVSGISCPAPPLPGSNSSNFFGFTSVGVADNNAYLSSIFYRVPGTDYRLYFGCNSNQIKPTGRILTPNGIVDGSPSTIPLDSGSNEGTFNQAISLAGMLGLVVSDYTCISNTSGQTSVFWNSKKIRNDLNASSTFGAGNTCTATGSPLGIAGTFTLKERTNGTIPAPTAQNQNSHYPLFCPLYNSGNPSNGYFGRFGVPYPLGTKIYFPSSGPITPDPFDGLVQYRSNASNCGPAAGYDCPPAGSNDYCSADVERYWSGIPNIQS